MTERWTRLARIFSPLPFSSVDEIKTSLKKEKNEEPRKNNARPSTVVLAVYSENFCKVPRMDFNTVVRRAETFFHFFDL